MKKYSKIIALILVFAVMLTITSFAAENLNNSVALLRESKISALIDARGDILGRVPIDENALEKIDTELIKLGAKFLSSEEVKNTYSISANPNLYAHTEVNAICPTADVPVSNKNTWISYNSSVSYGGQSYVLQRLVAQPKADSNSILKDYRTIVLDKTPPSFVDVAEVIIQNTASDLADMVIPGSGITITIEQLLCDLNQLYSNITEVRAEGAITYQFSYNMTVVFTYVRLSSQSDDALALSQISSKLHMLAYTFSTILADSDGFYSIPAQKSVQTTVTPNNYNETTVAISAFNNSALPHNACLDKYILDSVFAERAYEVEFPKFAYPDQCEW